MIIGQRVTPVIRHTASFLRSKGVQVTCVEFTFFQADGDSRLMSQEIVVGRDLAKPRHVYSGSLPVVSEGKFLESCDEHGKAVFSRMLDLGRRESMSIHWGTRGFSLGVDIKRNSSCRLLRLPAHLRVQADALYGPARPAGIEKKTAVCEPTIQSLRKQAEETELFSSAGRELKCHVNRDFTDVQVDALVAWCQSVAQAIKEAPPVAD